GDRRRRLAAGRGHLQLRGRRGRVVLVVGVVGQALLGGRHNQLAGAVGALHDRAGLPLGDAQQLFAVHATKLDRHGVTSPSRGVRKTVFSRFSPPSATVCLTGPLVWSQWKSGIAVRGRTSTGASARW